MDNTKKSESSQLPMTMVNKYSSISLLLFVSLNLLLPQDVRYDEPTTQQEEVDYWQMGKDVAKAEFVPKHTAPMGCIGGVLLGPVGWAIGYGLITKMGGRGVSVPPDHIVGLTYQESERFKKGYKEGAMKRRRRIFTISAAMGTSVFVFLVTVYPSLLGQAIATGN